MNCEMARESLEPYAGDLLAPAERAAVGRHLEGCASCRADLAALERVRAELPSLQARGEHPDVDGMWAEIRPRLTPRRSWAVRPLAVRPWVMAAAAAALITVSVGTTMLLVNLRNPDAPAASARLGNLEADYESAAAELARLLESGRDRLPAETVASIERNLAALDSAIAEARRALAADPGNLTLERFVLSAWGQKVELLRRATAAGTEL